MKTKKLRYLIFALIGLFALCFASFFIFSNNENAVCYASVPTATEIVKDDTNNIEKICKRSDFSSTEDINEFANENEYFYYEKNQELFFYNKFSLKTLIVNGNLDKSQYPNAIKLSDEKYLLQFSTIEDTALSYQQLTNTEGLTVDIDKLHTASINNYVSSSSISWGYDAINVGPYQTYLNKFDVTKQVVVAVVDSGINTSHIMFQNRLITTSSGTTLGFGVNTTSSSITSNFEDDNGHGTHVAGIICDTTPDNVKILPIKILDASGNCNMSISIFSTVFNKILEFESTYNIDVVCVNMSFGSDEACEKEFTTNVDNIFKSTLLGNNILPVVAGGNESRHLTSTYNIVPASCESAITVSALKKDASNFEFDSSYSNYGSVIDISAPGTAIYSAGIGGSNSYILQSGTSMATPFVSAVISMLCLDPIYTESVSLNDVQTKLFELAVDLGAPGKDEKYGNGMVSLSNFKGKIKYEAKDTVVTYDGKYHNISINVDENYDYYIKYGFTQDSITIENINGYDEFKNYTGGKKTIYFYIYADNAIGVTGSAKLTINKAKRSISINNQYGEYGDIPSLSQDGYTIAEEIYENDSLGITLRTNANSKSLPGEYEITYSYTNSNYYLIKVNSGKYVVGKRSISIAIIDTSIIYGETFDTSKTEYKIISGSLVNGDSLNLQVSLTGDLVVGGNNTLSATSWDEKYDLYCIKGKVNVSPRPLKVAIKNTAIYGDDIIYSLIGYSKDDWDNDSISHNGYYILEGEIKNNDEIIEEITSTAKKGDKVGDYKINIIESNRNYAITLDDSSILTILPREAEIKIGTFFIPYGDAIIINQNNYDTTNVLSSDLLTVIMTTTATSTSNCGEYDVEGTCKNSNYIFSITVGKLKITRRKITINYHLEFIYGEEIALPDTNYTIVSGNIVNDDSLNLKFSTDAKQFSNVGEYPIYISEHNTNYELTLDKLSYVKITPRAITASIGNTTSIYNSNIDLSTVKLNINGVLNNDDLLITLSTTATDKSDVGDYPITLTYNNNNYSLTFSNGTYTITPITVEIVINNQEIVYGSKPNIKTYTYDIVGDKQYKNLDITLTTNVDCTTRVGDNYEISVLSHNKNYIIKATNGKLAVTKRDITLSLFYTFTYGDNIFLDPSIYTVVSGTIVNSDKPIKSISAKTETNVKTDDDGNLTNYDISKKTIITNDNYNVTIESAKYEILPRPVTICILQTLTYGDEIWFASKRYNSDDWNDISITHNGYHVLQGSVVESDIPYSKLSTTATNQSNIGTYTITIAEINKNYTVTLKYGWLTIVERTAEIIISDLEVAYGNTLDSLQYTTKNIVNNDDLKLSFTFDVQEKSPVGKYKISMTYNNDNYIVTYNEAYIKIIPHKIKVSIFELTTTYGSEIDLSLVKYICYDALLEKEVQIDDDFQIEFTTEATQKSNVGKYEIGFKINNPNYSCETNDPIPDKLIIVPKEITIQLNPSGEYGSEHILSVDGWIDQNNDLLEGDILNLSTDTTFPQDTIVGEYPINIVGDNENYTLILDFAIYVIYPKKAQVTIDDITTIYGDIITSDQINTQCEGVLFDDDLGITVVTPTDQTVGEYDISATATNNNYEVTFVNGKLTINAKPIEILIHIKTVYGNEIDLSNVDFTILNDESLVGDDNLCLDLSTDASNTSSIGYYSISLNGFNENYIVTLNENSDIEITTRNIFISITEEKVYGDEIDTNNFNISIISGDIVNDDELFTSSAGNIGLINAGTYDLLVFDPQPYIIFKHVGKSVVLFTTNTNYKIYLQNSIINIQKRNANIIINDASKKNRESVSLKQNSYKAENLVEGDYLYLILDTTATRNSNVGEYEIFVRYYENNNYNLNITKGIFRIYPLEIDVEIKSYKITYGETVPEFEYTYNGPASSEKEMNFELNSKASEQWFVGTYPITLVNHNPNFDIKSNDATIEIVPRKIKIKLNDQTKGHFTFFKLDSSEYVVLEGEIKTDDDLGVNIYADTKAYFLWGNYVLNGEASNTNYEVEFLTSELYVQYSYMDTALLIVIAVLVLILIIVGIIKHRN